MTISRRALLGQFMAAGVALPLVSSLSSELVWADDSVKDSANKGVGLGESKTSRYRIGIILRSVGGPCQGLEGTAPMPIAWPEQKVRVVADDISPGIRADYRQVAPTVKQLVVSVPFLAAGDEARALITLEITRSSQTAPVDPSVFRLPAKPSRELSQYLGTSPGIEITHRQIRELGRTLPEGKGSAWEQVAAIYDWVRENVKYVNGPFKGAAAALKDGHGDCEELSSLFIAICRVAKIPARTVWVPDHCYPEFYLEDDTGTGHWIPCQAAGSRAFGDMPEFRPILQKGDNFRVPEKKGFQRYVAEHLTGRGGTPKVQFVREEVSA